MELKELLGLLDSYGLEYEIGGEPARVRTFMDEIEKQFIQDGLIESSIKVSLNLAMKGVLNGASM